MQPTLFLAGFVQISTGQPVVAPANDFAARLRATAIGCALAWGGRIVPALKPLYDYAWFVGLFAAGLTRVVLGSATSDTAEAAKDPT